MLLTAFPEEEKTRDQETKRKEGQRRPRVRRVGQKGREVEGKGRTGSLILEVSSSLERRVHRSLSVLLEVVLFKLVEVFVVVFLDSVVLPVPLPQRDLPNSLLNCDDLSILRRWSVDVDSVESIDSSPDLLVDEVVSKGPVDDVFVEFLLSDGDGSMEKVLLLWRERLLDVDFESSKEEGFEDGVETSDDSRRLSR